MKMILCNVVASIFSNAVMLLHSRICRIPIKVLTEYLLYTEYTKCVKHGIVSRTDVTND